MDLEGIEIGLDLALEVARGRDPWKDEGVADRNYVRQNLFGEYDVCLGPVPEARLELFWGGLT